MSGLIVHEWLEPRGGSENVVEQMLVAFPGSRLLTPWNNAPHRFPPELVKESVLARTPLRGRKALAVPALPLMWRTALPRQHEYDWVLVSSHLFAHQVETPGVTKLAYVHSPARYIWDPQLDGRGNGIGARIASSVLKPIDRHRAQSTVGIAANSAFVRDRIRRSWGRDAVVIHPPVDIAAIQDSAAGGTGRLAEREQEALAALPDDFLLGASRFIPYKRLELVIATGEASGTPVVLAGGGEEAERLRAIGKNARVPVHVIEHPSTPMLHALLRCARALVFPAVEDFGIVPVEAMAAGTPVVAVREGGVTESVVDGLSGAFVSDFTGREAAAALNRVEAFDSDAIAASVRRFDHTQFRRRLVDWTSQYGITPDAHVTPKPPACLTDEAAHLA